MNAFDPVPALPLTLASGSARRVSVLRQLGLEFVQSPADVDETPRPGEEAPALVERLARKKASAGFRPGTLTAGFDTVVEHAGRVIGKPADPGEAVRILARLADDTHRVWSGVALTDGDRLESAVERTDVRFRPLSPGEAEAYVATGEPLDKAGAYGIQGRGAVLVSRIEGDYFNVMGFPLAPFLALLGRFGLRYRFGRLEPMGASSHPS